MFNRAVVLGLALSASVNVVAEDIVIHGLDNRNEIIKSAIVWQKPNWINNQWQFTSDLDLLAGPKPGQKDQALLSDDVFCRMSEKHLDRGNSGKSPKFYCDLLEAATKAVVLKKSGKPNKIKVKFRSDEVYGEVLSSRLLWALGFGADAMYPVRRAHCYNCSEDPFKDLRLDPESAHMPRTFGPTAIERKLSGDEIVYQQSSNEKPDSTSWRPTETGRVEGWSFMELLQKLPDHPAKKYEQYVHRDALRLLAAFIDHLDVKPQNNRIVCLDGADNQGNCSGRIMLMINDLGATFGTRAVLFKLGMVHLKTFAERPVWKDPAECKVNHNIIMIDDKSMANFRVSEAGRQFLLRLLTGFSAGAEGRQRVENLFRAARLDDRDGPEALQAWVNAFLSRVEQIKNPMGPNQIGFQCPQ